MKKEKFFDVRNGGAGLGFPVFSPSSYLGRIFVPLFLLCPLVFMSPFSPLLCWAQSSDVQAVYVGSAACKDCHAEEYDSFVTYAKKSRSFESIEKLRHGLLPEEIERCYSCHTTGYGLPGGFVSAEKTPHLKNAGCEVCHGPGSAHAASRDPADIKRRLTTQDCVHCHTSERVKAFRYKPMVHGGAH